MINWAILGEPLIASASAAARSRRMSSGGAEMATVLIAAVAVVVGFVVLIAVVKRLLYICGPHEILVISGRSARLQDGSTSNYKIMHGGRGFKVPMLEIVRRMDMRLFPVEVSVHNAYSAGGIPLAVRAIANVKLSADHRAVRNAIERFLDYKPAQIAVAAQQTLEGVLREVISQLTPEEVNEDRLKFAEILMDNARDDFHKLGLDLDVLKVQHVSDDQEYLSNLGRARIANMLRDAENAENAANQAVAEASAQAREAAETAAKKAETAVVQAKNTAAAKVATLDAEAREVENQANMAAGTARMKAEQHMQELRTNVERLRLHCEVVLPAEAERKAAELKARGEAAPAIENGKATAEALRAVAKEWAAAGQAGRDVYILQQLQRLAEVAAQRVAASNVAAIKIVAGDEAAYSSVMASHPAAVASVLRELGNALGIDIGRLLRPAEGSATRPSYDAGPPPSAAPNTPRMGAAQRTPSTPPTREGGNR